MPASWIEHHGQRIIFADFRGLRGQAALDLLGELTATIRAAAPPVLVLSDWTGAVLGPAFLRGARAHGAAVSGLVTRRAAIGRAGFTEVLSMGLNLVSSPPLAVFDSKAEALAYLAGA
jgi:hypothetical protein